VVLKKLNVPYVKAKKPSGQLFGQITFAVREDLIAASRRRTRGDR